MPIEVSTLPQFLRAMADLLELVGRCQDVLFRKSFREALSPAIEDSALVLRQRTDLPEVTYPEEFDSMRLAGLQGAHLSLKLSSFEYSLNAFSDTASDEDLDDALKKGGILLGSLAGAIPGFGSSAQELVNFILKEIRKRMFRP